MQDSPRANGGLITLNSPPPSGDAAAAAEATTLLVSGLARSGTSMVARVLQLAGVPMGTLMDDVVFEDNEIAKLLAEPDNQGLRQIIARRNGAHRIWGFKRPEIQTWLTTERFQLFRKPKVILTFRDPVAISRRNAVAEYIEEQIAFRMAIDGTVELGKFIQRLPCPALLVSYEKVIVTPTNFVNGLLAFCGLTVSDEAREAMIAAIEASPEKYMRGAALRFRGVIDGVSSSRRLFGWCYRDYSDAPVDLALVVDGKPVRNFAANLFRQDLFDRKIGNGRHGFNIDLNELGIEDTAVITIRVHGRVFELMNSGRTVAELMALRAKASSPVA